jgi:predicted DNA-binding transcriptional regulator AlpA
MLATKIHTEATPRQHKPSSVTAALAPAISSQSSASSDLKFLQDFSNSKVLERLKDILQVARADSGSNDRAIRLPEVLHILSIGKSSWYQRLNARSPSYDPSAPQPFKLGNSERSPSVWWHSEIIAYLETRAAASRSR